MRPVPPGFLVAPLVLLALTACSSGSTSAGPEVTVTTTLAPSGEPSAAASETAVPTPIAVTTTNPTPSPTDGALETAPPPGAPTCKASTLTVTDADTITSQTTREQVYTVRTSGPDCGLTGYPAVSLKGADGSALRVRYAKDGSTPPPISLSRATSVSFSLTSARSGSCVDAASISVVLPGTGSARSAATSARACNGAVTVSPIRRLAADS